MRLLRIFIFNNPGNCPFRRLVCKPPPRPASVVNIKMVAIACAISAAVTIIAALILYYGAIDGYTKVPLPLAGQENAYLRGDGTCQSPQFYYSGTDNPTTTTNHGQY